MSARIACCLALALLLPAARHADADADRPDVAAAPSSAASASNLPSGAAAYNQAATADPYNRSDFSAQQSFGLTVSQMLGAAAACEQLHSQRMSLSGQQMARKQKNAGDAQRANLDAAQQYMLDPAATTPTASNAGDVDCERLSGSFRQLQFLQFGDQNLAKALDQADARGLSLMSSKGSGP